MTSVLGIQFFQRVESIGRVLCRGARHEVLASKSLARRFVILSASLKEKDE